MELLKLDTTAFVYEDIKLIIKIKASAADKMQVEQLMAHVAKSGKIENLPPIGRELARLFVVDWEGVTQDGKPVPFNYDLIYNAFPAELANTMLPQLYKFLIEHVDILRKQH